ncbi:MAG: hypothetical protein AAB355_01320 [Patescibacteria group bacterium]
MKEMAEWKNDEMATWTISFFTFWAWFVFSCTLIVVLNRLFEAEWNWVFVGLLGALVSWVSTMMMHIDPAMWRFVRAATTFPEPPGYFMDNDGVWKRLR